MFKNILVCIDGSASSEDTTLTAIKIARERNATLVGMAIVREPDSHASVNGASFAHSSHTSRPVNVGARAAMLLATFERRCEAAGVPARVLQVAERSPDDVIAEIDRHDLTLIGHDANFASAANADHRAMREKILRHVSRPVLLIPDDAAATSDPLGPTVLVAYDGGPAAARALASFAESGLGKSRDVHVATIGDDGEEAMETAMKAAENLRASGIKATAHSIVSALPDGDALVELATKLGAGLVVMGAFARSRIKEMFSGSLTRALVADSPRPLYLQH
ncbi:MAG: universal stress protein [Polyangia bacterium]|jgi:nucleotide-binding universal stress UspA family protein